MFPYTIKKGSTNNGITSFVFAKFTKRKKTLLYMDSFIILFTSLTSRQHSQRDVLRLFFTWQKLTPI